MTRGLDARWLAAALALTGCGPAQLGSHDAGDTLSEHETVEERARPDASEAQEHDEQNAEATLDAGATSAENAETDASMDLREAAGSEMPVEEDGGGSAHDAGGALPIEEGAGSGAGADAPPAEEQVPVEDPPVEPDPPVQPDPPLCDEATDNPCLVCQQAHCCEVRLHCLGEPACVCHLECRNAEMPETCHAACESGGDLYEGWLLCVEEHCAESC